MKLQNNGNFFNTKSKDGINNDKIESGQMDKLHLKTEQRKLIFF